MTKTKGLKSGAYAMERQGESAEITMYGEIVRERPLNWWGEPEQGDFIIHGDFLLDLQELAGVKKITLRMHSIGGDVLVGLLIHNRLRELARAGVQLCCVIDGAAMSAASVIMCACDDVRFIYVRDRDFYLSLRDTKDFIDWELNEVLDINGWDIKKALQHFHKSNATLFEWSNSPVVYYTTEEWQKLYSQAAGNYFACKPSLYHYYGTANKNYHDYLLDSMVKYKKYFYVLLPILACKWIEERKCPPPVLFEELCHAVLEDGMKTAVEELLARKIQMSESDKAPRMEKINQYIEEKLAYYKELVESMKDDRNPDWEPLEAAFRTLVYAMR